MQCLAPIALAVPSGAAAGEMGAISRGTVSISVIIPPHVMVRPAGDTGYKGTSSARGALCVETNGVRQYHLALLPQSGSSEDQEALPAAADSPACPSASAVLPHNIDAQASGVSEGQPLTLLVVPD